MMSNNTNSGMSLYDENYAEGSNGNIEEMPTLISPPPRH